MNQLIEFFVLAFILFVFSFILEYNNLPSAPTDKNTIPCLAFLISGSAGEGEMLKRLLQAIYHPNNFYIVHLDTKASPNEHKELLEYIQSQTVFLAIDNIKMIDTPNVDSETGPTKITSMLQTAVLMLNEGKKWDWFINLDAYSYPLVTQDDLLCVLSKMPRHLNFIDHTPQLIQIKEGALSGLYISNYIFTGSSCMGLARSFVEHCTRGWDNSSANINFQSIIRNSLKFHNTTVNTDLHFTIHGQFKPHYVTHNDRWSMWKSAAPFARKFHNSISDHVLEWIDEKLLFRGPDMLVPGGWCAGTSNSSDPCLRVGYETEILSGPGAVRLQLFFKRLGHNV